ncbi:PEP-CTERM sorting domain-containing protein [Luteolibacter marinus]|uniref:PEP-CTERM sorting domain-containing protein n=1 Tax=Luteolibacter marinus TaxID=2776705 RepID=UPI001866C30D|nr:PEP-CTERM sorting domain-containing protein [Luteolibacter marinus]
MKAIPLGVLLLAGPARAATISTEWTVHALVPDNTELGWSDSRMLSTGFGTIESVELHLEIDGGFNGDLYAYLIHTTAGGTGFSVLLNRVGRTAGNPDGSFTSGMDVTFSAEASQDIHTYSGSIFSGDFLPDARETPWDEVVDTDPRTATLSSFNGLDADGIWTLFVADVSPVFQSTVVSWGLTVTATPEISGVVPTGGLVMAALLRRLRRRAERDGG